MFLNFLLSKLTNGLLNFRAFYGNILSPSNKMITASNISKSFGAQLLFEEATFQILSKERIGVVGRNGYGKTTLFNLITQDDEPDSGELLIPKNYTIGYLTQHLNFTQPTVIEEAVLGLPKDRKDEVWEVEKILSGLGFDETSFQRPTTDFSSGYQMRINLAKALAARPHLLMLDEPTNFLDVVSIRWLKRFLQKWPNELLFITHDRDFMDTVATHTLGIHRRKIRKIPGKTQKFFDQILLEEEVHEKTRLKDEKKRKQDELFISKFRAKARQAGMVQSRIKALEKREMLSKLDSLKTLSFSFRTKSIETRFLLNTQKLHFAYTSGGPELVHDFNIHIGSQDRIAIIGRNGRGKTTLLRLLAGRLQPTAGRIQNHPALIAAHFDQEDIKALHPERTVEEIIHNVDPGLETKFVRNICGAMMFEGDAARKTVSVLSGGEKSRVCLGKLLAQPAHILLLDEPTNHLDQESCEALIKAMNEFKGAVVFVSHNERLLHNIPNRLVVFDKKKPFVFEGSYTDFLNEIGWDTEDAKEVLQSTYQKPSGPDRKTIKRLKAELQREKSQKLKSLKREMAHLETAITKIEKELHQNNLLLITASEQSDGERIASLSIAMTHLQKKSDQLYEQLDDVTRRFESDEKMFNKKLDLLK